MNQEENFIKYEPNGILVLNETSRRALAVEVMKDDEIALKSKTLHRFINFSLRFFLRLFQFEKKILPMSSWAFSWLLYCFSFAHLCGIFNHICQAQTTADKFKSDKLDPNFKEKAEIVKQKFEWEIQD